MPRDDELPDSEREFVQAMQADAARLSERPAEMNRETMLLLERSMCEKFRQLREDRGWSQSELSDRLAALGIEMHQTTIAKMEAGKRPLRVAEMFALAHAFQMPPGAVFFMPSREEEFSGLEALSEQLALVEEQIAESRRRTMELVGTFIDTAADYGVKRDHLIELMRDSTREAGG